jgi:hypothetical protein
MAARVFDIAEGHYATNEQQREPIEKALDQLLSVEDLRRLSLRDLRFLRNTIYARRGRPFKSAVLRAHFTATGWYHIDDGYNDAKLTKIDQRNIALIHSVENEFGGAISDEEHLIEPAIDGA